MYPDEKYKQFIYLIREVSKELGVQNKDIIEYLNYFIDFESKNIKYSIKHFWD